MSYRPAGQRHLRMAGRMLALACIGLASMTWSHNGSAFAQTATELTNAQRWQLLDCYKDMTWDSSACRKAGVQKRGEFFYGPLGSNNPDDKTFDSELSEMLIDCTEASEGYCDNGDEGNEQASSDQPSWKVIPLEWQGGKACSIGIRSGDVLVGLAARNSREYIGTSRGLFDAATRATWRVDNGSASIVDGGYSSESGNWYTAETLPPKLLIDMANGRELALTGANGNRAVITLAGAKQALTAFALCRENLDRTAAAGSAGAVAASKALGSSSRSQFTCQFRFSEVRGFEVPRGMMTQSDYLKSFEYTRVAITFDLETKTFLINGQPVKDASINDPEGKTPNGSVVIPYSSFSNAVSLTGASGAATYLTADQRRQLEGFLRDFGGAQSKTMSPNRYALFDAAGGGSLKFFDFTPTVGATNLVQVLCR